MKRLPVILSIVLVVACVACLGLGALFLFMQSQTVAQATAVPTRLATLPPQTPAAMCAPTPFSATTQSTFTPEITITAPAFSDKGIRVALNKYTNGFPKALTFQIEAEGNNSINEVALIVMLDGQTSSSRQLPEFTPGNKIQATYEWTMARSYVPPGVTGQFWWTLADSSGNQIQTPKQSFRMDDPGRTWQKLANDKLAVYWYGAGDSFGKALFDRGVEAMQFLLQDTCVVADKQVQAFIYPNRTDFRNALSVGAQEWTGGQAFPDYSIVLINVAPQELEWGKGATTHELTHQVIHQRIKSPLGDLSMPHWMDEGLAMYYETYPGTLDSQFSAPLKRAIQNDTAVPLRTLSGNFPADSAAANLAYAQSYAVVDFIYRKYGRDKMVQLLQEFKTGGAYDDIFKKVLGVDTDGLDNAWRQEQGLKPRVIPTRSSASPTPFPTFGLSTDATPTPKK